MLRPAFLPARGRNKNRFSRQNRRFHFSHIKTAKGGGRFFVFLFRHVVPGSPPGAGPEQKQLFSAKQAIPFFSYQDRRKRRPFFS